MDATYQGPEHLSYSAASKWTQCPRKAWRHYALKDYEPPQEHLVFGVTVHRILELAVPERADQDRLRAIAAHVFKTETVTSKDWRRLDIDVAPFKHEVWRQVVNTMIALHEGRIGYPRHVELALKTTIEGVAFTLFIDHLWEHAKGLVVGDYKSGQTWVLTPQWNGEESFAVKNIYQLMLYAVAVEQELNEKVIGAQAIFTREDPTKILKFGNELRERAVQWLLDADVIVRNAVRTQEAPPNPGPLCGWCGYLEHCPEGRKEVAVRINRRKNISEQHADIAALPPYELQHWVETAEVTQVEALTVTEASIRECIELELKRPSPRKGRLAQYVEDLEKRFGVVYELDAKHKPKRRAKKAA